MFRGELHFPLMAVCKIGFAATLMLACSWYQVTLRFERMQVFLAVLISLVMFFLTAAVLIQIPGNALTALLVLYAFSVHWTYPLLGVYLGTVVSLSLAVIYILIYYQLSYRCQ